MAPIKVGFIGYGLSTNCFHLPFILPNSDLEVYAFLQRRPPPKDRSEIPEWGHCTIDFPQAKHYQTADEFFADPKIEVVVVCTRDHEEFVQRSIDTGKHVVVEKAFVTTSAKAEELTEKANKKGIVLAVFHNRRYDSDFRTVNKLVKAGALGEVLECEIHFDMCTPPWAMNMPAGKYSPGQGIAFGLGPHTIDQAIHLFGKPASVTGFLRANRGVESEIDDTYTIILQYSGKQKNLLVTVKTAVVTHMKDQLRFFVRGTEGTFLKFGNCPQEARANAEPGKPAKDPNYGVEDESIWGTLTTTKEFDPAIQKLDESSKKYIGKYPSLPGWYRGYYENIVDAIRGKAKVNVTPEEATMGLKIIELARQSHAQGCTMPFP